MKDFKREKVMSKFKNYINNEYLDNDVFNILETIIFIEEYEFLTESIISNIKNKIKLLIKKAGLHVKSGEGLIHHLIKASKGISQIIYHSFNAYYNNNKESKEKVKEISKSLKKEDILDFLLKLDMVSLHMVTGPIHIIDALTGMHIWANIKGKVEPAIDRAKKAIESLEELKGHLEGKLKQQVQKYSNALRRVFSIGDMKKYVMEQTLGIDIATPDIKIGDDDKSDICPITGKPKKKKKKKTKLRKVLNTN